MREPRFFPDPDLDKVVAMIMELGAQLHVERAQRLALEEALVRRGLLTGDELDAVAAGAPMRSRDLAEADRSLRALLGCLLERDDADAPLAPLANGVEVSR